MTQAISEYISNAISGPDITQIDIFLKLEQLKYVTDVKPLYLSME